MHQSRRSIPRRRGEQVDRIPSDKRPEPRFHVAYVDVLGFRRLVGNKMRRGCHASKRSFVLVIGRNSTMISVLRGG